MPPEPTGLPAPTDIIGADSSRLPGVHLRVVEGEREDVGRSVFAKAGTLRVGKDPSCDLMLHDSTVSRQHVELAILEDGIRVRDLGSTNGTFYLGQRLVEAIVRPGARITLGRTSLDLLPGNEGGQARLESERESYGALIGSSQPMRRLYAQLERLEGSEASVLISGESGTGKELAARAIHEGSARKGRPLVVVDCGNLQKELVGSALFGHHKGAFTGAIADQMGAFEAAHGGTIFLDEIGELPADMQPRLLRVLETGEITRIGETRPIRVDVRVLAATNRDLFQESSAGRFRVDLYYRLAVIHLTLPPLRERREDIPAIIERMVRQAGGDPKAFPQAAREFMLRYDWLGNARELRNAVQRILVLGTSGLEGLEQERAEPQAGPGPNLTLPFHEAKRQVIEDFESAYLKNLLEKAQGNISRAARSAGIDRKHLRDLLRLRKLYVGKDDD
ncbi:MAG: sigma 54-interacting transcriptional regulator [Deltaproteobacteria bacterium]|nr:sigma 54-interacting transcriptional regulator [Deltaproteobacteria bacterium]